MTDDEGQAFFARIEYLEQQLAECQAELDRELQRRFDGNREASKEYAEVSRELVECQAREKVLLDALADAKVLLLNGSVGKQYEHINEALAMPSDSTALDTLLKRAKREALLDVLKLNPDAELVSILSSMAKELET